MLPLIVLALSGCGLFKAVEDFKTTIGNLTNPVVVQGVILELSMPEDALLQAAVLDAGLQPGLTATLFVADASNASELDQAVAGASVTLQGVAAAEGDPGVFSIWPTDGLVYRAGETWRVGITTPDGQSEGSLSVELPSPAPVLIPEEHPPGEPMQLDLTGLGFDSVLAYVFDSTGEITWTNQPDTALEVFDLTQSVDGVQSFEIPGAAFPDESIYAVAVAGMVHSRTDDLEGVNTFLSNLMAGQLNMYPVFTSPGLTAVGQILDIPEPEDPRLSTALQRADLSPGTAATVFLADALADVPTLEEAAMPGGTVTLLTEEAIDLLDEGDGYYTLSPEVGVTWETGATWTIDVANGPASGALQAVLPDAPELLVPEQHRANTELVVDLTGQLFQSAVLFVVDADGEIVFSNEPETIDELADIIAQPLPLGPVAIPAKTFPRPGLYGVALAAYEHAPTDGFTGLNPELSALLSGRMVVAPLPVVP